MKKILRFGWVLLVDTIAVLLLLTALAIGWLPATPGIPIALAGLGLLAINHEWANLILLRIKSEARKQYTKVKHKLKKQ